jgi:hypothetical protein
MLKIGSYRNIFPVFGPTIKQIGGFQSHTFQPHAPTVLAQPMFEQVGLSVAPDLCEFCDG